MDLVGEVRNGKKGLSLLLRGAKEMLKVLNVELSTATVEWNEPVALPQAALDPARKGLTAA